MMFPSTASSQSNSGMFGRPPFGLVNEKGDTFGTKTLRNETVFGFPSGMPNYGVTSTTSTWGSGQTSSHLFSTTFGAPSFPGFGSSITSSGSSSSTVVEGSRIAGYRETPVERFSAVKLLSISAMPTYEAKSHEELRWEDYKLTGTGGFGISSSVHLKPVANVSSGSWGTTLMSTTHAKPNPFGKTFPSVNTETTTLKHPYPTHTPIWKYPGPTSSSFPSQPLQFSPFATPSNSFNPFGPTTTLTSTATHTSSSSFSSPTFAAFTSSLANTPSSFNTFWSTPIAGPITSSVSAASSQLTSNLNQPTTLFNPFVPSTLNSNGTTTTTTTTTRSIFDNITNKQEPSLLNAGWATPIAGSFPSSVTAPANSASVSLVSSGLSSNLFQPTAWFNPFSTLNSNGTRTTTTTTTTRSILDKNTNKQDPSSFNAGWATPIAGPFPSLVTAPANSASVSLVSSGLSSNLYQPTTLFNPCVPLTENCNVTTRTIGAMLSSAANPFGTLPPKPQMFFDGSRSTQYGISSIPVKDKPARIKYSLLTTRNLSRRNKLPIRKYDPNSNGPKIPYFCDTKEIPVAAFVPRENPRALIVSSEMWSPRGIAGKIHDENFSTSMDEKESDAIKTCSNLPSKLQQPDYYTIPPISELEAKEKAEPGFCSRVKDFVIGCCGYGSIKFLGETDVQNLDLETLVQFNHREVIVYMDETKKPRVGEGLNKPAEVTLLNIKCMDKRRGMQYIDGPKVDRYTEMLKKKAGEQGAEFISYDPVEGEWKFRVQHF